MLLSPIFIAHYQGQLLISKEIIQHMDFIQESEPDLKKPIVIAAMQDMGNVGGIVIDFLNKQLKTQRFRLAKSSYPTYVIDKGGYIGSGDQRSRKSAARSIRMPWS